MNKSSSDGGGGAGGGRSLLLSREGVRLRRFMVMQNDKMTTRLGRPRRLLIF